MSSVEPPSVAVAQNSTRDVDTHTPSGPMPWHGSAAFAHWCAAVQLSLAPHDLHAPPPAPHAAVVSPARHVVPSQQPSHVAGEHDVGAASTRASAGPGAASAGSLLPPPHAATAAHAHAHASAYAITPARVECLITPHLPRRG